MTDKSVKIFKLWSKDNITRNPFEIEKRRFDNTLNQNKTEKTANLKCKLKNFLLDMDEIKTYQTYQIAFSFVGP